MEIVQLHPNWKVDYQFETKIYPYKIGVLLGVTEHNYLMLLWYKDILQK
jgi:hypothetical protein